MTRRSAAVVVASVVLVSAALLLSLRVTETPAPSDSESRARGVPILARASKVESIALGEESIYWSGREGISSMPKSGGAPQQLGKSAVAYALTFFRGSLYWLQDGAAVYARDVEGRIRDGVAVRRVGSLKEGMFEGLATDETLLCWGQEEFRRGVWCHNKFSMYAGRPDTEVVTVSPSRLTEPEDAHVWAVVEGEVYYSVVLFRRHEGQRGAIRRVREGHEPDTVAEVAGRPQVVVHGGRVFWSDEENGRILGTAVGGGVETVAAELPQVQRLAAWQGSLYGITPSAVFRVSLAGGDVETLASLENPRALAVDGTGLYVADDAALYRLPLPAAPEAAGE